ncbi:hypothetical protein SH449x_001929 [Pirellulaceae bacterium SH449]
MTSQRRIQFGTRVILLTTIVAAVLCGAFAWGWQAYYSERHAVLAVLNKIKGISYTLDTVADVSEKVTKATIAIDGIPDSQFVVVGLPQYAANGRFAISQIGRWRFVVSGLAYLGAEDSETGEPIQSSYLVGYLTLGTNSPYQEMIPFPVNTLQDLINHYQQFVTLLESWPIESAPGRVFLDDGSAQSYFVFDKG